MKNATASEYYSMKVDELKKKLENCPGGERADIAAMTMFGDVELTIESAKRLLTGAPDFDVILTSETNGIPLAYEMARQSGKSYFVAHRSPKMYMSDNTGVTVNDQGFSLDIEDLQAMNGKRVLIADDVVSTGRSLKAMEALVEKAGGIVAGKVAVLAEKKASERGDIIFLESLPAYSQEKIAVNI
nr:phosphoribosyltransferase family protein [Ruminococcus sp.]